MFHDVAEIYNFRGTFTHGVEAGSVNEALHCKPASRKIYFTSLPCISIQQPT
jgi:hypothetical protein